MFVVRLIVGVFVATTFSVLNHAHTTPNSKQDRGHVVAQSNASDPAARQIGRTVANETLKPISTKDSALPIDEDGPILTPTKVEVTPAPGIREPAQATTPAQSTLDMCKAICEKTQ